METSLMKNRTLVAAFGAVFGAAFGFATLMANPAWADIETARQLLTKGDAEGAIAELEPLAYGGDVAAMNMLGAIYHHSDGVTANYSVAWTWYLRAANTGDSDGQFQIARMLWNGEGVPRNEVAAVDWYSKAAENRHEQARLELGLIYRDGKRQIRSSSVKALALLEAAAKQGNIEAELALEEMFERGQAPREEMERFRTELAVRQMSEPDRIRTAIVDWIRSVNTEYDGTGLNVRPDVVVTQVGDGFEAVISDLVLNPEPNEAIRVGTVQILLTPIGTDTGETADDFMATRRYDVKATVPNTIEMQRGIEVLTITYEASQVTGTWLPSAFTMPTMRFDVRNIEVVDQSGQTMFTGAQMRAEVILEETEPGEWSGPSAIEMSDLVLGQPEEGVMTIGRFMAATTMEGFKLEPYGQMANQAQTDPDGFMGVLLDPEGGPIALSNMMELIASSRFKMTAETIAVTDPDGTRLFDLAALSLGAEAHQTNSNNASLAFSYGHSGLSMPSDAAEADLIPSDVNFAVAAHGIPTETLGQQLIASLGAALAESANGEIDATRVEMDLDMRMAELSTNVLQSLSAAGTGANIDFTIETQASDLELDGEITAQSDALFGLVGSFDLTVEDLASLVAIAESDPQFAAYKDLMDAFVATARTDTDASNANAADFAITINPAGEVMINEQDAMAIVSSALIESDTVGEPAQ
jgi:TPR repeat protein